MWQHLLIGSSPKAGPEIRMQLSHEKTACAESRKKVHDHAPQVEDVAPEPPGALFLRNKAVEQFWGGVGSVPCYDVVPMRRVVARTPSATKISEFPALCLAKDENVGWLYILVGDVLAVQLSQPCGDVV